MGQAARGAAEGGTNERRGFVYPICALLFTSTVTLAGCAQGDTARSGDRPPPSASAGSTLQGEEILRISSDAMRDVGPYHIHWRSNLPDRFFEADFRVDDGGQCAGQVSLGTVAVEVISTGDATYQKGNADYWRQDAGKGDEAIVEGASGRWVKTPPIEGLAQMCDPPEVLMGEVEAALGQDPYIDPDAPSANQEGSTVALTSGSEMALFETDPPHRLLSAELTDISFVFSKFDEPVSVEVPNPGEYVDFNSLLGE